MILSQGSPPQGFEIPEHGLGVWMPECGLGSKSVIWVLDARARFGFGILEHGLGLGS